MSYIYNKEVQYSDTSDLDAFGRLRVSNITSLLDLKNTNNRDSIITSNITIGSGSYSWASSSTMMDVITDGDKVIRSTKTCAIYQAGKSQLFEASFSNFNIENRVIKRIGIFTTDDEVSDSGIDGIFLESNGVNNEISFQIWNKGNQIVIANTNDWHTTDYDINNIDWSLDQLLMIDYQWLGVGRIRFSLIINGRPVKLYDYTAANNLRGVYMEKSSKPIRYEILSVGGAGSLVQTCSQISTEGSLNNLYESVGATNGLITLHSTDIYPILGYRLGKNSEGTSVILNNCSILQTTNDNYIFYVLYNPVISDVPNWESIDNTPIEKSIGDGVLRVTDVNYIISTAYGAQNSMANLPFVADDNMIRPGIDPAGNKDEIWICIEPLSNNSIFGCSANLKYFR